MTNIFDKLRSLRDKKRYEVILHDRTHLTDYEKDVLMPELKSRLGALKLYFEDIITLCSVQRNSEIFKQCVLSVINPDNFKADPPDSQGSPAEKFFDDIKFVAKNQGVDDIDRILDEHQNIENVKGLSSFLTDVNNICSALAVVNNNLLLYKIETYPFLTDLKTGQTAVTFPPQYSITIEPFQVLVTNIVCVAKATSESIHEWHKYAMKLKLDYLQLYTERISVVSNRWLFLFNIATIVLAIALSAFFLLAADPFNLIKENRALKSELSQLQSSALTADKKITKI